MCFGRKKSACSWQRAPLESLSNSLTYQPMPTTMVERKLCRSIESAQLQNLKRVLFIPSHNNTTPHLPIYRYDNEYTKAIQDADVGSSAYKVGLMFLRRPRGDGVNENVDWHIDLDENKTRAIISKRSMNPDDSTQVSM